MKLYINSSDNQKIIIRLDDQEKVWKIKIREGEQLLIFLDQMLKKQKKTVKDLSSIEVNLGPGSFMGLRIGLAVANTLGWALQIPVNGKQVSQTGAVLPRYG